MSPRSQATVEVFAPAELCFCFETVSSVHLSPQPSHRVWPFYQVKLGYDNLILNIYYFKIFICFHTLHVYVPFSGQHIVMVSMLLNWWISYWASSFIQFRLPSLHIPT